MSDADVTPPELMLASTIGANCSEESEQSRYASLGWCIRKRGESVTAVNRERTQLCILAVSSLSHPASSCGARDCLWCAVCHQERTMFATCIIANISFFLLSATLDPRYRVVYKPRTYSFVSRAIVWEVGPVATIQQTEHSFHTAKPPVKWEMQRVCLLVGRICVRADARPEPMRAAKTWPLLDRHSTV